MPLDQNALTALTTQLTTAFTSGQAGGGSSDSIALLIAAAYDTYAKNAISCAGVGPTLVKFSDLQTKKKEALSGTNPTPAAAAQKWADALDAYWEGSLFGATGSVVTVGGATGYIATLTGVFGIFTNTIPVIAQQIAQAMESYTKLVLVRDSAVPPPSGCGPSPIS